MPARDHHGALRSSGCLDRSIGPDCRLDFNSGTGNWRCALVALAREPRPEELSERSDRVLPGTLRTPLHSSFRDVASRFKGPGPFGARLQGVKARFASLGRASSRTKMPQGGYFAWPRNASIGP